MTSRLIWKSSLNYDWIEFKSVSDFKFITSPFLLIRVFLRKKFSFIRRIYEVINFRKNVRFSLFNVFIDIWKVYMLVASEWGFKNNVNVDNWRLEINLSEFLCCESRNDVLRFVFKFILFNDLFIKFFNIWKLKSIYNDNSFRHIVFSNI